MDGVPLEGGVEVPGEDVPLAGGVDDGVVLDGMLLGGMLLGGRVLGVVGVVPGAHGPATVAEVPFVPAVPVAPGVELPIVVEGVLPALVLLVLELLLGLELVLPTPVVEALPLGLQGAVVPGLVPLGVVVDWLGVVVPDALGFVVVGWPGTVVVVWLGVVVVDCDGVTPVALGVPGLAEGVVCVADGLPTVLAPPGVVAVVPGVPGAPAVPVPAPVVWAAATPMATVSANEANKIFFMKIAPWSGLNGQCSAASRIFFFFSGMPFKVDGDGIGWPRESVTVQ